ncbi:MAG: hypothetical protein ACWGO1_04825, partial [Anaerolineales bacterium]
MKRYLPIYLVLVLFVTLSLLTTALAAESDGGEDAYFRVDVRNRSGGQAILTLSALAGSDVYRLVVPAGEQRSFTISAGRYAQTTYACGGSATGTLDVSQQLRLVFPPCAGSAPNAGAPTLEKVHLYDSPSGVKWRYQYGPLLRGFAGSGSAGAAGTCEYTATAEVTIYSRPDTSAQVFSVQPAGLTVQPSARSASGWLGFDPAVAQAANIGPFRLRWLPP